MLQTTKLIGTEITSTTTFKNISKVKFAPDVVQMKYRPPNGVVITIVVTPDQYMTYEHTVLLDVVGTWKFRWESLGAHAIAEEFEVFVEDTILN